MDPRKDSTPVAVTAHGGRGESGDLISSFPQLRVGLKPPDVAAVRRAASAPRFSVYVNAVIGDEELACQLYLLDRDLAASILRDIALVEVALRNALSGRLLSAFGQNWYLNGIFDSDRRLKAQIDQALGELAKVGKVPTSHRVTAQLPLGFWINLLDARCSEAIWRGVIHHAFPGGGGRPRSKKSGTPEPGCYRNCR